MDKHSPEQRRKNMQAVKSSGSKIEDVLAKAMWTKGLRYRKQVKNILGKPDFAFRKYKIAIFCDSEFWHGKNWDTKRSEIKSNQKFWHKKIERNIQRDKEVNAALISQGWIVLRFWGKEILNNTQKCLQIIEKAIQTRKSKY
ncbi:MAG: very short patch repair endonuclease [Bacteroidales bacterium]|nr:very short patch repair endonuclease [Bacteroidales bacterium]